MAFPASTSRNCCLLSLGVRVERHDASFSFPRLFQFSAGDPDLFTVKSYITQKPFDISRNKTQMQSKRYQGSWWDISVHQNVLKEKQNIIAARRPFGIWENVHPTEPPDTVPSTPQCECRLNGLLLWPYWLRCPFIFIFRWRRSGEKMVFH